MRAYVRVGAETQTVKIMEVSKPKMNRDEVLIKVESFGVGIHDRYFIPQDAKFPYIIGSEGAGVITEIGSEISDYQIEDRVIFSTVLQPQGGSWAEYAVAKESTLISMPDSLSFAQGATLPVAGKTALESMRSLNLKQGDTLFIAGASGAIGTLVIQLAAAQGIRVAGSASEHNHSYMKSLGAEKTVDYHSPNWQNEVLDWSNGGVSAALAIQPKTGSGSLKVVKDGGRLITVSGDSAHVVSERDIHVEQMGHHPETRDRLVQLVQDIADRRVQVHIEKEYSFDNALAALEKTETRHARGKVVVVV